MSAGRAIHAIQMLHAATYVVVFDAYVIQVINTLKIIVLMLMNVPHKIHATQVLHAITHQVVINAYAIRASI